MRARGHSAGATVHGGASMKCFVRYSTLMAVLLACGAGTARAQTPGAAAPERGYAEVTAGATFGHRSNSSIGVEAGYRLLDINSPVVDELHVFAEVGRMGDVATADVDARALLVANAIGASVSTMQEATYFDAGLKFRLMQLSYGAWRTYVLFGVGAAQVKTSANFSGGSGVQVLLGQDLSGTLTKPLVTVGVGTNAKIGKRLLIDITYRYGRIFPKPDQIENDVAINTQRLQAGIGIRF
jgi:opacity protein-like surface antigen